LNDRRNNLLVTLAIRLEEYGLAAADLQEETIRLAQGASNDEILRRRQISEYSAAFGVLQTLRSLDLLKIEVENLKK